MAFVELLLLQRILRLKLNASLRLGLAFRLIVYGEEGVARCVVDSGALRDVAADLAQVLHQSRVVVASDRLAAEVAFPSFRVAADRHVCPALACEDAGGGGGSFLGGGLQRVAAG